MKWIEFKVHTSPVGTELLSGVFAAVGINELNVDCGRDFAEDFLQDSATVTNWDFADIDEIAPEKEPSLSAYIADLPENKKLTHEITARLTQFQSENPNIDLGSMRIETRIIDDEDWANNWKKFYKPTEIGEKLLVCPSWEQPPAESDRVILKIDPGMAFGTGLHETTRMCLIAIEKCVKNNDRLIDLGCGSGILSIAAKLLGANTLLAVDVDPVCTEVSAVNAKLNNVTLNTKIGNVINDDDFFSSLMPDQKKYDVVVANIVAGVLISMTSHVSSLLNKDGLFISSGIIRERLSEVIASYTENGFEIVEIQYQNEWTAITAKKVK